MILTRSDSSGTISVLLSVLLSVVAFPLRNDWDEGSNAPYSGADWCRRLAGQGAPEWNAPGAAADHGEPAAEVMVTASQPTLSMKLDPGPFEPQWITDASLSLLLIPQDATFVFVTHEDAPWNAPRLVVQYRD